MKFIAGAAAAALVAAGLTFATAPAQAAPDYTPKIQPTCKIKVSKQGKKKVVINTTVRASGVGKVQSVKKIKIRNAKGKVIRTIKLGKKATKKVIKLPKGKYSVQFVSVKTTKKNVIFKQCSGKGSVRR
jgi:flagellar hook assembly protein FlgD